MPAVNRARRILCGSKLRRATLALAISASVVACGSEDDRDGPGGTGMPSSPGTAVGPVATADAAADASSSAGPAGTVDGGAGGSQAEAGVAPARDAGGGIATDDAGAATTGDASSAGDGGTPSAAGACTRELLAAAVESYYKALSAHDPKLINASPSIKLTQDGKTIMLGEGLMKTAGMVKLKRSALDTLQCETVTESVVVNGSDDYVVGVRLKLSAGQVSEVESILVGPDGWFPNPGAVVSSASDNWELVLPEAERTARDKIKKDIIDGYFIGLFGGTLPVAQYPFASECKRAENGFSPGACNFGIPTSMRMMPLHYVVDVEAGIGVGFVLFGGRASGLLDFHLFRVKSGKVYGVRAVVGPTVSSRGWPNDLAGAP